MMKQRLDKWISSLTDYSRKEVKALIREGRVLVAGETATDSAKKYSEDVSVIVDGQELTLKKYSYIMMNKPAGVLSVTQDNVQPTALELLPEELWRPGLFPAGRLDKDTEGFLFITNDGALGHRITSPRSEIGKTYYAELTVTPATFEFQKVQDAFSQGVELTPEGMTSPAELVLVWQENNQSALAVELTIYEGMYHQVKRMFSRFGAEVTYLKRVSIGKLALDESLKPGEAKELNLEQVTELWQ